MSFDLHGKGEIDLSFNQFRHDVLEALGSSLSEALLPVSQLLFVLPSLVRQLNAWSLLFPLMLLYLRLCRPPALHLEELFLLRHKRLRCEALPLALSGRQTEKQQLEEHFEELSRRELSFKWPIKRLRRELAEVNQLPHTGV